MLLISGGCAATKTSFLYEKSIKNKPVASKLTIAISFPKDERIPNKRVDRMWDNNLIMDIDRIIKEEIINTGLVKDIVSVDDNNNRITLYSTVKELAWEVPNYDAMIRNTFLISVATGGLGGLAYGSTDCDFYGKAKVLLLLTDKESKNNILEKEYYYRAEEKIIKLKADSTNERARIIGIAFKHVMDQFKADLEKILYEGKYL